MMIEDRMGIVNRIKTIYNNERFRKIFPVVLFVLFFIYGMIVVRHYGISTDEAVQRKHGLEAYRFIYEKIMGEGSIPSALADINAKKAGGFYGMGIKFPVILVEAVFGFGLSNQNTYLLYHIYTFFLFYISTIYAYRLARLLDLSYGYRILMTVLYASAPRILADSFYNIKDAAFVAIFTVMLYYAMTMLDHDDNIWNIIGLVISAALAVNTRVIAALPLFVIVVFYFFKNCLKDKKKILMLVGIGLVSVLIYLALSPAAWKDFGAYIHKVISKFSNYTYDTDFYVAGIKYNSHNLPWYYLSMCIWLTMPFVYTVYGIVGLGFTVYSLIKKNFVKERLYLYCIFAQFAVIFLTDAITTPDKYNLWRHFYFLEIYLAYFSIIGIIEITKVLQRYKYVIYATVAISLLLTLGWIIKNHPYEYVYFNPFLPKSWAAGTIQDYWHVAQIDLMKDIKDDTSMYVYQRTPVGDLYFTEKNFEDYHRVSREARFLNEYYSMKPEDHISSVLYNEYDNITVDGRIIDVMLKRKNFNNCLVKYCINSDGTVTGTNPACEVYWNYALDNGVYSLVAEIPDNIKLKEIDLYSCREDYFGTFSVWGSNDGETWNQIEAGTDLSYDGNMISVITEDSLPKNVKFEYAIGSKAGEGDPELYICGYGVAEGVDARTSEECGWNYNNNKISIYSIVSDTLGEDVKAGLTDAEPNTGYLVEGTPGDKSSLTVELNGNEDIVGFYLDPGTKPVYYPQELVIFGSEDGEKWETIHYNYGTYTEYLFDRNCDYRYYKLETILPESGRWSVSELAILRAR